MTQDTPTPPRPGGPSAPGSRAARRVSSSRAVRRGRGSRSGGRRKAPQPGRTVFRVILSSLLTLGLLSGVGMVLIYNKWNGNLEREDLVEQLGSDRPEKEEVAGEQEPLNILVMGSDTRAGEGNGIDGESGGGLSDTTILFHLSANREFAYGISIPRDTAVMRPTCYRKDGSEIPAATEYSKWNAAFATGGPACTIRQLEQLSGIRIDNYVVVDFNGFKDMVDALDGVEVCIPEDINDEVRNIYLKAGTREIKGNEALTYVRARYRIGDGTDTNRTRRQQAFIGSMINKALTGGMLARPDRLLSFGNAATESLRTDFDGIAQLADIAATAQGIGADNIKFITTPWGGTDKVSGGVEWTPEVNKLWRLVRRDKPLTAEFLEDALSAGDNPDGSPSPGDTTSQSPSDTASGSGSESASDGASDGASDSASDGGAVTDGASNGPAQDESGLSDEGRAAAGLC